MTRPSGLSDRLANLRERLQASYTVSPIARTEAYIETLSPGDKLIALGLAALVCVASAVGVYKLERTLLVTVPAYGGSLTEGVVGSPRFINPLLALSDADRDLTTLTYAGLMGLSGDGTLVPVLAEGYEVSDDGRTYTFILRADTTFSDGSPLTSADVVFTVERAQDPAIKSPLYASWSGVRATAIDPRTVRFTLAKPYAPFVELTTLGIMPARLWQTTSTQEFSFVKLNTHPVGAGPFVITDVSTDGSGLIESVTLSANKRYVLGRPYLDRMTMTFFARTDDLRRALADGKIDSAYDLTTDHTLTAPYARVFGVFWNQSEKPVYARLEVRKALSQALDRDTLVRDVLGGYATAITGPVPPESISGKMAATTPANPTETAAATLRAAGWSYDTSERVWRNASAKQVLDTITLRTSNVPELKNVAAAMKADWEKLGVPVSIELYEPGDLSQNIIRPRKYEALLYGMVIGRNQDLYAFWSSQERNDPGLNIALYANKTVDALLEDARSNTDARERARDLEKIDTLIASEYPAAFAYAPAFIYGVPSDLRGVALPQIVVPADRFASVATWYRATDVVWPFLADTR